MRDALGGFPDEISVHLLLYKWTMVLCPSVRVRVLAASYPARVLQRRYAWGNVKTMSVAQRRWLESHLIAPGLSSLTVFPSRHLPRAIFTIDASGHFRRGSLPRRTTERLRAFSSGCFPKVLCMVIWRADVVHCIPKVISRSTCPEGMPQGIFVGKASQGV